MFNQVKQLVKSYLVLLRQRPEKKLSKRKLKKLQKKEAKLQKKLAKKSKIALKTANKTSQDAAFHQKEESSGWDVAKKPATKVPEIHVCKNCQAVLAGQFCHECGQKNSDFQRPYWTFVEDFSDNVFSKDSRLWRTLGYLLFLPGAMTREYIAGKRIRFLPPIRTFLISIVMFFMTVGLLDVAIVKITGEPVTYEQRLATLQAALAEEEENIEKYTGDDDLLKLERAIRGKDRAEGRIETLENWRADQLAKPDQTTVRRTDDGQLIYTFDVYPIFFSPITEDDIILPADVIDEEFEFNTGPDDDDPDFLNELAPKVKRGLKNAAQDPTRLNNALNNWVPLIMGIFVPLTALFLRFYYWKREHFLYNHLVFSLHFHTYLFFVLTFFVLAQVYSGSSVSIWMFAGAMPLYFFIALKISTGQGWIRTFFKFLIIALFYGIGFLIMLLPVFILSFAEA